MQMNKEGLVLLDEGDKITSPYQLAHVKLPKRFVVYWRDGRVMIDSETRLKWLNLWYQKGDQIITTTGWGKMPEVFAIALVSCLLGFIFVGTVRWLSWSLLHHWHESERTGE
jgi:hypothetical protein